MKCNKDQQQLQNCKTLQICETGAVLKCNFPLLSEGNCDLASRCRHMNLSRSRAWEKSADAGTAAEQRPAGTNAWQRSERSFSNLQDEETFTRGGCGFLSQPNTQTWGSLTWRINVNPFHSKSETRVLYTFHQRQRSKAKRVCSRNNPASGHAGTVPAKRWSCYTHTRQLLLNDTWSASEATREPAEASKRPVFK